MSLILTYSVFISDKVISHFLKDNFAFKLLWTPHCWSISFAKLPPDPEASGGGSGPACLRSRGASEPAASAHTPGSKPSPRPLDNSGRVSFSLLLSWAESNWKRVCLLWLLERESPALPDSCWHHSNSPSFHPLRFQGSSGLGGDS